MTEQVNLEAASVDELRSHLDNLNKERRALAESIAYVKALIAKRLSKYTIGDILTDHNGHQWLLTKIDFTCSDVDYFGRMLKKDGTPGMRESYIPMYKLALKGDSDD